MKKIDLFDTFENAEDELMEDLTDMSPEFGDEQFEKLLAVSERNYKMKKEEIERTKKDNNINHDEDSVSGVDRVKRPAWLAPLLTAASLVLITGAVIGSVVLLNRNGRSIGGEEDFPAATTSAAENTAITTTAAGTDAVTEDSGTTTATTTAEETTTEVTTSADYAPPPFVEPKAEDMYFDEYLGNIALEMCKKEELEVNWIMSQGGVDIDTNDNLEFSLEPSVAEELKNYFVNIKDGTTNNPDNKVYYARVDEPDFDTLKEMEEYGRSVYAENHIIMEYFHNRTGYIPDEMEQGDLLSKDLIKNIIEYRGKLYKLYHIWGIGYLPRVYHEEYPVIIADKTDTSFRAFIPYERIYDDTRSISEEDMDLLEIQFVMDPEYNDWRMENDCDRSEKGLYKKLADKIRG